jgi:D-alanyl-D-alanine dipeptidase
VDGALQLYASDARCLAHESPAPGLKFAANQRCAQGNTLVFWDCYRPHDVQVRMFQAVSNPNWVARPSNYARSHEAGRSVDVTIAGLDMGTDFDDLTPGGLAYGHERTAPDPRRSDQLSGVADRNSATQL